MNTTVKVTTERIEPTQTLTADQRFFFDHAGGSYFPAKETKAEGFTRGAIELAAAEDILMNATRVCDNVSVHWVDDQNGPAHDEKYNTCKGCYITIGDDKYASALWAITDADEDYRRVVRAELATEVLDQLKTAIRAATDYGYLHHGTGTAGPFRTERVRVKNEAPDNWFAKFEGKWRKVHIQLKRLYIVCHGEKITIQIEGV